jgi:hypothetical protein
MFGRTPGCAWSEPGPAAAGRARTRPRPASPLGSSRHRSSGPAMSRRHGWVPSHCRPTHHRGAHPPSLWAPGRPSPTRLPSPHPRARTRRARCSKWWRSRGRTTGSQPLCGSCRAARASRRAAAPRASRCGASTRSGGRRGRSRASCRCAGALRPGRPRGPPQGALRAAVERAPQHLSVASPRTFLARGGRAPAHPSRPAAAGPFPAPTAPSPSPPPGVLGQGLQQAGPRRR